MDRNIQRARRSRSQEGGSTDVGDVSWIVPTLHLSVATAPQGCALARLAGRRHRRHVDRAQGHDRRVEDAGRDDGRPVRAAAALREVRAEFEKKKGARCSRPICRTARRRVPKD